MGDHLCIYLLGTVVSKLFLDIASPKSPEKRWHFKEDQWPGCIDYFLHVILKLCYRQSGGCEQNQYLKCMRVI